MKRPIRSQGVSNQRTVQIHERRRIYQTDLSDPIDPKEQVSRMNRPRILALEGRGVDGYSVERWNSCNRSGLL